MRFGYAQTARGAMHYAEAGAGEAVLLLHATPRSHRYFRHTLPLLAAHFRAIAVDAPGFGNSHALPKPASMRSIAECFVQFLDALGLQRAHVVGLHTGNKIAAALAAHWPARVGSVVLAGQTHSLILDKTGRDEAIRRIVEHYFGKFAGSAVRQWAAVLEEIRAIGWDTERPDPQNAEMQVLDYLQGWPSIVPVYEAIFSFDMEDALRRMEARALVLELLTPQEMHYGEQAGRLRSVMKHAKSAAMQGDGEVFETRPGEATEAVVQFLRRANG